MLVSVVVVMASEVGRRLADRRLVRELNALELEGEAA
jgi:hypothetical protein